MADKDQINPTEADDDLPILADDADDASFDNEGEEYDVLKDMDDHDRHVLNQLTDEELAALSGDDPDDDDGHDQSDDAPPEDDGQPQDDAPPAPARPRST